MIKICDEECEIRGKGIDIIQEFCGIIRTIREEQPEVLAGVFMAWSDILMNDLTEIDRDMAHEISKVAYSWIELNEVEE